MKFTQIPVDTGKTLQMNAGILLKSFEPSTGVIGDILGATSGGVNFNASPAYSDFFEDVDNAPTNVKEGKKLTGWTATMSGTFVTVTAALAKQLVGAGDIDTEDEIHIIPRNDVLNGDFEDLWWVGDYSDVNTGENAGFLAIHLINALSTGGFQIQSNDDGKGNFAFEYTGHYTIENQDKVPFEIYVKQGEIPVPRSAKLNALTIGSLTLDPVFDPDTTSYTAATTDTDNIVTATVADNRADVAILVGTTPVSNGTAATWTDGDNTVTVTVTNEDLTEVYTITVTATLT